MKRRVVRVGGVHEPFNLPWLRTFSSNAFDHLDLDVTFETFAGGTGALVEALEKGTIDLATLLTEGAVTAIARGSGVRIHSGFTTSPLSWGIHLAADSQTAKVEDLEGARFAISRRGSGSELMAHVLAEQQGWSLAEDQFVVVGGLEGAMEALPEGRADAFLWERFVTASLVRKKVFKRVGDLVAPWPAFVTAARPGFLDHERGLVDDVVATVLDDAADLVDDEEAAIATIMQRYGMNKRDTRSWLNGVAWSDRPQVDEAMLRRVMNTMEQLGRIDAMVPIASLL